MSDVFISYSRRDQVFVHRLFEALSKDGRSVWVDWEDIPATVDWWQQICAGIEGADNFVVILSPNSLASPICQLEVAHATKNNKRIVPVIIADPEEKQAFGALAARDLDENTEARLEGRDILIVARDNWKVIARHNWITFKDENSFEENFRILIDALETDPDYVRKHTRLLLRAQEWVKNARTNDYLLRGEDLDLAQQWLNQSQNKQPIPLAEHIEYIEASATYLAQQTALEEQRKLELVTVAYNAEQAQKSAAQSETRAKRASRLLAFVGVISLAVISLSVFSFMTVQRDVTNAQSTLVAVNVTATEINADITQQRRFAEALRLAAEAKIQLEDDSSDETLAALLSIRSIELTDSLQGDLTLDQALSRPYVRQVFPISSNNINHAEFSSDRRMLLTCTADGLIMIWEVPTARELLRIESTSGIPRDCAFSPDGSLFLTGDDSGAITLRETVTGEVRGQFEGVQKPIWDVAFSPDMTHIASVDLKNLARVWDLTTYQEVRQFEGSFSVTFTADGRYLLVGGSSGKLWDIQTGELIREFPNTGYHNAYLTPDGSFALIGVQKWYLQSGRSVEFLPGLIEGIGQCAFQLVGPYVTVPDCRGGGGGYVVYPETGKLWDLRGNEVFSINKYMDRYTFLAASPDGKYVLTSRFDSSTGSYENLKLWEVHPTRAYTSVIHSFFTSSYSWFTKNISAVALSSDRRYLITSNMLTDTWLTEASTGRQLRQFVPIPAETGDEGYILIVGVAFSPDNRFAALGDQNGVTHLWDLQQNHEIQRFSADRDRAVSIAFSPDGRFIITGNGDATISQWDIETGEEIHNYAGHEGEVNTVIFSHDGQFILSGGDDSTARLWNIQDGQLVRSFRATNGTAVKAIFSPDEQYILAANGITAILWDKATGNTVRTFTGHTDLVNAIAFSPDGKYVITGSDDGTARIWEVSSGREIRRFTGQDPVYYVGFSADGRTALTDGGSELRYWNIYPDDVVTTACSHAYRDFTEAERAKYQLSDDNPTCPQFDSNLQQSDLGIPFTTPIATQVIPAFATLPSFTPTASITPGPSPTETNTPTETSTSTDLPYDRFVYLTSTPTLTLVPLTLTFEPVQTVTQPVWTPVATATPQVTQISNEN